MAIMDWLTNLLWHDAKLFGVAWSVWKGVGYAGPVIFFSVAYHWTKKRVKKTALPSQPMTFQKPQSMPISLPLCQSKLVSQSIMATA